MEPGTARPQVVADEADTTATFKCTCDSQSLQLVRTFNPKRSSLRSGEEALEFATPPPRAKVDSTMASDFRYSNGPKSPVAKAPAIDDVKATWRARRPLWVHLRKEQPRANVHLGPALHCHGTPTRPRDTHARALTVLTCQNGNVSTSFCSGSPVRAIVNP